MLRPKSTLGAVVELIVIVAVAIGLALLIQAFLVKPYVIPSGSMIPTLEIDQRVLVQRVGYRFGEPEVGDIVVFHPPVGADEAGSLGGAAGPPACGEQMQPGQACGKPVPEPLDENYIKRVVATPGDTLAIVDGHAVVNGKRVPDDFARPCGNAPECNLPKEITIPPDHYFMMGDNRGQSQDSRIWGPVPKDWIIGKAFATYWPPNRIGIF
jgi:signal peptidase I